MSNNNTLSNTLDTPWYLYTIQAFAAWLAAIFVLAFSAFSLQFIFESSESLLVSGGGLLVAAWFMQKQSQQVFATHFALALSLNAQLMILIGFWELFDASPWFLWGFWALLQAVIIILFKDTVTRFVSSLFLIQAILANAALYGLAVFMPWLVLAFCCWAYTRITVYPALNEVLPVLAMAGLLVLLFESSLLTMVGSLAYHWYPEPLLNTAAFMWLADVFFGVWSVAFIWLLFTGKSLENETLSKVLAVVVVCVLFALYYFLPQAVFALAALLLGFARGSRALQAIAVAALLFFISQYYYYLPESLLGKSFALLQVGTVFLVLYFLLTVFAKSRGFYEEG